MQGLSRKATNARAWMHKSGLRAAQECASAKHRHFSCRKANGKCRNAKPRLRVSRLRQFQDGIVQSFHNTRFRLNGRNDTFKELAGCMTYKNTLAYP